MKTSPSIQTPNAFGFRMPAEWEPHEATWLGWPHELTDWPGKFAPVPWAFAEMVRHLSKVERVFLLVESRESESRVRTILKKSGANLDAVDFFRVPTDRGVPGRCRRRIAYSKACCDPKGESRISQPFRWFSETKRLYVHLSSGAMKQRAAISAALCRAASVEAR